MSTLFVYPEITVEQFKRRYGKDISVQFVVCADSQLTNLFELRTGLKINKQISIAWIWEEAFYYTKNEISKLPFQIFINNNWNPVTILWRSKSGRIYDMGDTDIDCDDIEFWFEGLEPVLYHKQLYPKDELPFKLKDLSFELVVTRLNLDCTIEMHLPEEQVAKAPEVIREIDAFIEDFNNKSEKQDRKYGVIHNWRRQVVEQRIVYEIDLGSAGPLFFKKLLPFLSKLKSFSKVEIS